MRSIVIGAIVAAGLSLVSAVPTVSAPECCGHRASRGRYGSGDAGPLLVQMARLARLLPALAVLVRGFQH